MSFKTPSFYCWVLNIGAMGILMIAAWKPNIIPFSLLGPVGPFLERLTSDYSRLLKSGCVGLWLLHVAEALYVFRLCRKIKVTVGDTGKWILQTLLLGIWSTSLIRREACDLTRGIPHRWRDSNQQQQYRRHSSSKDTDGKEVAHTLSLELADKIAEGLKLDEEKMKTLLNHFDNFSLVDRSTNRSGHRVIDNSLVRKHETGGTLTAAEKARARRQLKFLQHHRDECPATFYRRATNFYKSLGVD